MLMLRQGSIGQDVAGLQVDLNARNPTELPRLAVDRIFGPKTAARVQEFQRLHNLEADGIVGPLTRAKFAVRDGGDFCYECGNGDPGNRGVCAHIQSALLSLIDRSSYAQSAGYQAAFQQPGASPSLIANTGAAGAPASSPAAAAVLIATYLKSFRPLSASQLAAAGTTYGDSIDLSVVMLTDLKGAQGRPFTFTITPELGPIFRFFGPLSFINLGTFTPATKMLLHELAHVWQSQHHSVRAQYMANSLLCQGLARRLNDAAAPNGHSPEEWVKKKWPVQFPHSAYAYRPGLAFGTYNAEQIAKQVENGEAPIIAYMKKVPKGAVDAGNEAGLLRVQTENRLDAGVKF